MITREPLVVGFYQKLSTQLRFLGKLCGPFDFKTIFKINSPYNGQKTKLKSFYTLSKLQKVPLSFSKCSVLELAVHSQKMNFSLKSISHGLFSINITLLRHTSSFLRFQISQNMFTRIILFLIPPFPIFAMHQIYIFYYRSIYSISSPLIFTY